MVINVFKIFIWFGILSDTLLKTTFPTVYPTIYPTIDDLEYSYPLKIGSHTIAYKFVNKKAASKLRIRVNMEPNYIFFQQSWKENEKSKRGPSFPPKLHFFFNNFGKLVHPLVLVICFSCLLVYTILQLKSDAL